MFKLLIWNGIFPLSAMVPFSNHNMLRLPVWCHLPIGIRMTCHTSSHVILDNITFDQACQHIILNYSVNIPTIATEWQLHEQYHAACHGRPTCVAQQTLSCSGVQAHDSELFRLEQVQFTLLRFFFQRWRHFWGGVRFLTQKLKSQWNPW